MFPVAERETHLCLQGVETAIAVEQAGLGAGLQKVSVPPMLQGTISIFGAEVYAYRTFIILVTVLLTALTWFILYRTSIGTQIRAIIRNPKMAAACGIDVERVVLRAVDLGLTTADQARRMNEDERLQLIFASGLSTAEQITETSGRGLGMTAVKETIEALGNQESLHPLQKAFIEQQACQCGYCGNGMVMSAKALLAANKNPSEAEIKKALDGHLCRCASHNRIVRAVQKAAKEMQS